MNTDKEIKPVALVTGGSKGIGAATALAYAEDGYRVAVADIDEPAGGKTVDTIKENGGDAVFIFVDVADFKAVKKMMDTLMDIYGRLDCAFNNAGIEGKQAAVSDCTLENWERVLAINLNGVFFCMKAEIPRMLDNGGGAIVNMASVAGKVGFPNIPAYTAAKHGIIGLTRTAALDCAQKGIRVNAVCPGVIHTEMIDRFTGGDEEALDKLKASEPMNRLGRPEEVARAVLWLSSNEASFVTGHPLMVDGGFVAR